MAQKVQIMLVCDLHDGEVEGVETISFGLDGTTYEIDVCEEHANALRDSFASYVGAARRAGRGGAAAAPRRGTRAPARPAAASDKQRVQDIREWARSNGHQVSDRGRLSAAVVQAYEQAH